MDWRKLSRAVWTKLTRAYHYEFDVVRPFAAIATISRAQRQFKPGERVICETRSDDSTIMFEMKSVFYLVDRSVFEACCKARKPTTMPS